MKKNFYINNKNKLNKAELQTGRISYARIIERYTQNKIILCNNIAEIDDSIWENIQGINFGDEDVEIFQYYLCDLTDYEKDELIKCGIILSYSNLLGTYVLCVDHWGTSWDYVMTDVKWTENFKEVY